MKFIAAFSTIVVLVAALPSTLAVPSPPKTVDIFIPLADKHVTITVPDKFEYLDIIDDLANSATDVASRGLTSLERRYTMTCDGNRRNAGTVELCILGLRDLGRIDCEIRSGVWEQPACIYGDVSVWAFKHGVDIGKRVASHCIDCASGLNQLALHCNWDNKISGSNAACGNGELILEVR